MHFTTPILFSLLTSTALALPTTTQTSANSTSALEKRTPGWVGAFQNVKCSGKPILGAALVEDKCVKWSPVGGTSHIGINYGTILDHVYEVTFYADDDCTTVLNGDKSFVRQADNLKGQQCTSANMKTKSFKVQGDIAGQDDKIGKPGK